MLLDFQERVALVTGAASGIGRATAATIGEAGAYVVGLDRDAEPGDGRASFDKTVPDGDLIRGDVLDSDAVATAVEHAETTGGDSVTVAVNCAGVGSSGSFEDVTRDDLRRAYRVHVEGTFTVCQRVLPRMRASGGGSIVNTSSIAARIGWPATADYAPAKGAIEAMTRELAAEVGGDGVRVNATAPGFVKTGMNADVWESDTEPKFDDRVDADTARDRTLVPYLGEPADVATVNAFLASDAARFVTGQVLPVDGGWTVNAW